KPTEAQKEPDGSEAEGTPEISETKASPSETEADESLGTDEPTDVIKGIGSTYADRLADAGVETVADLAARDAEALAVETGISEKRLGTWIERARHR
ncbi:MAG: helix-hairpin-helix domain-containing protein, partial [Halapricum sp.]